MNSTLIKIIKEKWTLLEWGKNNSGLITWLIWSDIWYLFQNIDFNVCEIQSPFLWLATWQPPFIVNHNDEYDKPKSRNYIIIVSIMC
jgi:hypothetical protein